MNQTVAEALGHLYGDETPNLTWRGYSKALRLLRARNPSLARRVERALEPFLQEHIFPRKGKAWTDSSVGVKARLVLLSGNPHFKTDVHTIRQILGIPGDQIKPVEDEPLCQELREVYGVDNSRDVVEANTAGWWLMLHYQASIGRIEIEGIEALLSQELVWSAEESAKVDFQAAAGVPDWLLRPTQGSGPDCKSVTPIHWATERLLERHQLPRSVAAHVTFFILTQNPSRIEGLEGSYPVVKVSHDESNGQCGGLTMVIHGIDEFSTKGDWDRVWDQYIRPRQAELLSQRGMRPRGRWGPDLQRLERALPDYRAMVQKRLTFKEVIDSSASDQDQETVRKAITDLGKLLRPLD